MLSIKDWLTAISSGEGIGFAATSAFVLALLAFGLRALVSGSARLQLRVPLLLLVSYFAFSALSELLPHARPLHRYLGLAALLFVLLAVGRMATVFVVDWLIGRRLKRDTPQIVRDIVQGLLVVLALLVTLRSAGVDATSILTTSALLTAIIGLSLQDTLGNLFAGLSLQAQQPFSVGEWIQVGNDPTQVGRVIEINWRATKLRTSEHAELVIPNAPLARAPIINYSRPTAKTRRVVTIVLPVEVATRKVHDVIMKSLAKVPGVLAGSEASVATVGFVDLGVQYAVRYFIESFDSREALDSAVRDRIWYALQRAGIPIVSTNPRPPLTESAEEDHPASESAILGEREHAIAAIDFLQDLPQDAIAMLARDARNEIYQPGEIIVRQGESGEDLYLCRSGELVILHTGNEGRVHELARLHHGAMFGEIAQMSGEPRRATVQAVTACELVVVGKAAFQQVLSQHPELVELIGQRMAERQAQLEQVDRPTSPDQKRASVDGHKRDFLNKLRTFFSL